MAAVEPLLLPRANSTWFSVDGAITIVAADDPVELALRRDRVAKRARDQDLREEADARGWSSAISERGIALRRRSRPTSSPFCGTTKEEHICFQEAAPKEPEPEDASHAEHEGDDGRSIEHFFISIL